MLLKNHISKQETRSVKDITEHYELEKALASKLRNSSKEDRVHLYTALYDELFSRVPNHPQLTRKSSLEASAWVVSQRLELLSHFLNPETVFLEIGPGDCSLSIEISKRVSKVYAIDVSNEIASSVSFPENLDFALSDGCSVPVPANSVNLAYSHQLMEHLHPDDALEQLQNIYTALSPKGLYICITPNRLSGPHDVSKYFDEVATGFHLKEYSVTELNDLFRKVGFSKVNLYKSYKQNYLAIPLNPLTLSVFKGCEELLSILPFPLRRKIANLPLLFRGMTIVGTK